MLVNKNFSKLFGYKVSEVTGKNSDKLIFNSDTIIEASKLTSKAEKGERVFIETIRYNKHGNPIYVSILGVPIFFRDREMEVYAIYRDITKRKMAEKKLKQLKENLERIVKKIKC